MTATELFADGSLCPPVRSRQDHRSGWPAAETVPSVNGSAGVHDAQSGLLAHGVSRLSLSLLVVQ